MELQTRKIPLIHSQRQRCGRSVPLGRFIFICAAVFLITPDSAEAYIDPGSGGLVYQVLILVFGLIAGYLAFLKKFIKSLFSSKRSKSSDDTQE